MSVEPFGVLVSSAGRRGALVQLLRQTLRELGLTGEVAASDQSPLSAAFHLADRGELVPPQTDPGFIDALLEICERRRIRLLIPTHDGELPILAAARTRFGAVGTTVAVSSPAAVAIGRDKVATHAFCNEHGFPTVRQASRAEVLAAAADWPWPLVAKPRFGSAAIGVSAVTTPSELAAIARDDLVVQTVARGTEHTVDVLVLRDGIARCAVPRRRIEVRAGEVAKAVTVREPGLEALALAVVDALPAPYGALNVQIFRDAATGELAVIEINARFGGGFPLAHEAGARFPRWLIEDIAGLRSTVTDDWRANLTMLRYDAAVYLPDLPT